MLISGLLAFRLFPGSPSPDDYRRTRIQHICLTRISLRIPHHTTHCLYPLIVLRFDAGNEKMNSTSALFLPVFIKAIRCNTRQPPR